MDIEKLKETLIANGIDEETIVKILADLEKEPEEKKEGEEPQAEGKTEEEVPPANPEEGKKDEKPEGDVVEETVVKEEGALPPEGEVPPPPTEGEVPPTDVPPTDVPPEGEVPPAPPIDIEGLVAKFDEQKGIIEEQAKTIEGLGARIQSLEDALSSAGVLEKGEGEDVGIHNSNVTPSGSNGAVNEMTSVLAKLNGNKHF